MKGDEGRQKETRGDKTQEPGKGHPHEETKGDKRRQDAQDPCKGHPHEGSQANATRMNRIKKRQRETKGDKTPRTRQRQST